MAASATYVGKRQLGTGGLYVEYGNFTSSGGTTTVTITADTTEQPEIGTILMGGGTSNGDTAIKPAMDAGQNKLKLTFTANDAGNYWFIGKAQ